MNAQLFKWSPDGWREGIPKQHGTYRVRFLDGDDFTPSLLVTPISDTEAVYQVTDRDTPTLLPATARWQCVHDQIATLATLGRVPQVTEAICEFCGAHGKLLTRADLEVESA